MLLSWRQQLSAFTTDSIGLFVSSIFISFHFILSSLLHVSFVYSNCFANLNNANASLTKNVKQHQKHVFKSIKSLSVLCEPNVLDNYFAEKWPKINDLWKFRSLKIDAEMPIGTFNPVNSIHIWNFWMNSSKFGVLRRVCRWIHLLIICCKTIKIYNEIASKQLDHLLSSK